MKVSKVTAEFPTSTNIDHPTNVVNIAVFPSTIVNSVFLHGDFGSIEDRRLIHVVPDEEILGRALIYTEILASAGKHADRNNRDAHLELFERKLTDPPVPTLGIEPIGPSA